ncbi:MAG: redoxin domain-containing protein [Chitinophagaceae bacterium]
MSLEVGKPAPLFSLYDSDKNKINLIDFRGKNVVLLFFPQAFTGTCTVELCSVRDNLSIYEALDAEILAISVDSVFTLARFKEEQQYNFKLLSDFNKEISTLYHTIYEDWILDMKGVSKRSAFVIDKKGDLKHMEILENPGNIPSFQAIQETLSTLK